MNYFFPPPLPLSPLTPSSLPPSSIQWSLRLDPNDRPTCSQLLRHELFTKGGWGDRFTFDLRGKVEHELEDNPLLKAHGNYAILQDARRKTTSEGQSTMLNPPKRHAQVS